MDWITAKYTILGMMLIGTKFAEKGIERCAQMAKTNWLVLPLLLFFYGNSTTGANLTRIPLIESRSAYTRLILPMESNSGFKIKESTKKSGSIKVHINSIGPNYWTKVPVLSDSRISRVQVLSKRNRTLDLEVTFANRDLEYFAYFQPTPPAIVVDVWSRPSKKAKIAKIRTRRSPAKKKVKPRKPSRPKFDWLSMKGSFFYRMPIVSPEYTFKGKHFNTNDRSDPGAGWKWNPPPASDPILVNYTLAQKLFETKKYGLCIRAVEFTERDFPPSPALAEMNFLKALAYGKLGEQRSDPKLSAKSDDLLRELMLYQTPDKKYLPFATKIRIYFAANFFRKGMWMDAISEFEFMSSGNQTKVGDIAGILGAAAQSYLELRNYRVAERIYRNLMKNYRGKISSKEAYYRIGNLLALEGSYFKADQSLRLALKKYPKYESVRQEVFFNLAEVNFWHGRKDLARKYFKEFIWRHPSHTIAGLAMVRLGEISELKDRDYKKASSHYHKAINRFPFSIGAKLAMIRFARLNLPVETDLGYQIKTLGTILKDKSLSKTALDMAKNTLIQYLLKKKEWDKATTLALNGITEAGGLGHAVFERLYVRALMGGFHHLNSQKKYLDALKHYNKYERWLDRDAPSIYQELASAYRGVGLINSSNHYSSLFLSNYRGPSSLRKEKQSNLIGRARGYMLQNRSGEAEKILRNEKSVEGAHLRAVALQKMGKEVEAFALAKKTLDRLTRARTKLPKKLFDHAIADLTEIIYQRQSKRKDYKKIGQALIRANQVMYVKSERFCFLLADNYWYQQKHVKAVTAYTGLIKEYPKSSRLGRARYRMGLSHIALGDRKSAVKVLTKLRDNSQNLWGSFAKEELKLIEWEDKYSVILGDLPPVGLGIDF